MNYFVDNFEINEFLSDARKHKILDLSVFDLALTVIFGLIICERCIPQPYRYRVYWSLMPLSVFAHLVFKQDTELTRKFCEGNLYVLGIFIFCLIKTIDY